jgi:hypothetical protein
MSTFVGYAAPSLLQKWQNDNLILWIQKLLIYPLRTFWAACCPTSRYRRRVRRLLSMQRLCPASHLGVKLYEKYNLSIDASWTAWHRSLQAKV